ncbi:Crooked neck-like protein 1 [Thelohanellus kitauei]|uniref:Crooked neck-like protein 1 n=1 Tax=Thelohanellus kitauei TaxID=669202 RepID=A0A0C2MPD1_THEKT|nr:Crooked neck-like protein 1 [Thelohanellus kitauei]
MDPGKIEEPLQTTYATPNTGRRRKNKEVKIKNKAPATVQITAEQLLREARERQFERLPPAPKQKVIDGEEMDSLKLKKRKEYEDNIKKNRLNYGNWIKYARWEESNAELDRARSVFERAIDTDYRIVSIWLKYGEMEMRHRQINHARNVYDRAVTLLPRVNQFWYKYTYMEELMENIAGARNVFERWMEWRPDEQAWLSYIKMELRYKEVNRARAIYERFVTVHPDVHNWIRFAKFEEINGNIPNARLVYERAVEFFGELDIDQKLIIAFARFEESCREFERARLIYKYCIEKFEDKENQLLLEEYAKFEKRHGDRIDVEEVIIKRRKHFYEENIESNPYDYDSWFDYISLLENEIGDLVEIRDAYERVVATLPPVEVPVAYYSGKKHWKRYIYFWIRYAIFEELTTDNIPRVREIFKACLNVIPHKNFSFSKIWILFAQFEIRQGDITAARKILGTALGKCPSEKLYREYIEIEISLYQFQRARILYEKYIELNPSNCVPWIKYAEMEMNLGNTERAAGIYELATSQENLNMPEVLWKSYIDFAIYMGEYDLVRNIYERLLERTAHSKVWISYAQFEAGTEEPDSFDKARAIFRRADEILKQLEDIDQRILLVKTWKDFEDQYGTKETIDEVKGILPRKVKKRRRIIDENGNETGWEEYFEYAFGDTAAMLPNSKLLKLAKLWKAEQEHKA